VIKVLQKILGIENRILHKYKYFSEKSTLNCKLKLNSKHVIVGKMIIFANNTTGITKQKNEKQNRN
jgi:hypothetical protein